MVDRIITPYLKSLKKSVLLLGPRQVGKSTLAKSLGPDRTINFADEGTFLRYSKDLDLLRREVAGLKPPSLILLDEIQRIPQLLNTIQVILDGQSGIRFILTGSSARKLKRGQANLLPGRVIVQVLDPLNYWELGPHFNLEKVLRMGSLPGIYLDEEEGLDILESYALVYLREEIQQEAITKQVGSYARFLDVAAQASGDWINYSKISSDTEIPKETVRRFFSILEETLIAFRLPPFQSRTVLRKASQRDRFFFFDVGVRNALLGIHRANLNPIEQGKLFEQWIILQCVSFVRSLHKPWKLYTYRTRSGAEVDLVIDCGSRLLAVECKWSEGASVRDFTGLKSFASSVDRPVEKLLVYRGTTVQKFDSHTWALPFREFLDRTLFSY